MPGATRLALTDAGSGRTIFTGLLADGEVAVLTWTNSLFNLTVTETFEARGGVLLLTRVRFAHPKGGAVPRARPEDLDDLYQTGGPFQIDGLAKPVAEAVFRVGEIGQPTLTIGDRVVRLAREVGFGGAVKMEARRPTAWEKIAEWVGFNRERPAVSRNAVYNTGKRDFALDSSGSAPDTAAHAGGRREAGAASRAPFCSDSNPGAAEQGLANPWRTPNT
jgi:hypothetical protein